jgi:hypothetical protein
MALVPRVHAAVCAKTLDAADGFIEAVKGFCYWAEKQELLTAECAKKGRKVHEEIQSEPLLDF